jgi:hypothetical protein
VCNCVLAHDNTATTCAAHTVKAVETITYYLEGEELMCVVAGLLFVHRGMRPGRPVVLQRELLKLGIETTTEQIHKAKEKLERRGLDIAAVPRKPGYILRDWLAPSLIWAARQRQRSDECKLLDKGSEEDEEDT